jgi:anti-sigma B factor antagonist
MTSAGGRLKLCGIAPDIMAAFRITRFDRLFEIHEHESTALDSF